MKLDIDQHGRMSVRAESDIETLALKQWKELGGELNVYIGGMLYSIRIFENHHLKSDVIK